MDSPTISYNGLSPISYPTEKRRSSSLRVLTIVGREHDKGTSSKDIWSPNSQCARTDGRRAGASEFGESLTPTTWCATHAPKPQTERVPTQRHIMASLTPRTEDYVHLPNDGAPSDDPVSSLPPPPYTRVLLQTSYVVTEPPLPLTLQPHVSDQLWQEFWVHLKPTLDEMKQFTQQSETVNRFVLLLFGVAYFTFVVCSGLVWGYGETFLLYNFIAVVGFLSIFCPLSMYVSRVQTKHVRLLQAKCQEQDAVFRPRGFAVEYHYECDYTTPEPAWVHAAYFVPLQETSWTNGKRENDGANGAWRIPIFVSGFSLCHEKEAVSQSLLESYRTLPIGTTLAATNLWSRFWPEMMERSHAHAVTISWNQRVLKAFLVIVVIHFVTVSTMLGTVVYTIFTFVNVVGMLFLLPFYCRAIKRGTSCPPNDLVSDYANEFAQHGVWIEYRRLSLVRPDDDTGLDGTHFLYVFPLPPRETPGVLV